MGSALRYPVQGVSSLLLHESREEDHFSACISPVIETYFVKQAIVHGGDNQVTMKKRSMDTSRNTRRLRGSEMKP